MADEEDKVRRLPVRYLGPLPDRSIVQPWEVGQAGKCQHLFVTYIVDEAKAHVECGACHESLNPMWVLKRLANEDRRYAESVERAKTIGEKLKERVRTKCEHCGQMTRIKGLR